MIKKISVKLSIVGILLASLCMTGCDKKTKLDTKITNNDSEIFTEAVDVIETEDVEETEEFNESEVRYGSRMAPLGVGDSIDLVTRDTETYQITYFFTITLSDVTNGIASFDIKVNDSSKKNPLKLFYHSDGVWNSLATIIFCGSETAASCDREINCLGVTEDVVIGCGESGTAKVDISGYKYIGVATMFYKGDVEPDPTDYDVIVHPTATDVPDTGYQYLTVFKVP